MFPANSDAGGDQLCLYLNLYAGGDQDCLYLSLSPGLLERISW